MEGTKRTIKVEEVVGDIRAGMHDEALAAKYHLSRQGLLKLFRKLLSIGAVDRSEILDRRPAGHGTFEVRHRFTDKLLFSGSLAALKDFMQCGAKTGQDLSQICFYAGARQPPTSGVLDLSGIDLTRARLAKANLSHVRMRRVKLVHADLAEADLFGTELAEADLTHSILRRANLIRSDLTGARLTAADLSMANLGGAILTGCDLTDAGMSGAIVTGTTGLVQEFATKAQRHKFTRTEEDSPQRRRERRE
ncbi:MAG: pentapeptide repeat-containing protein [Thermodesulfobacteriota bacterium]